MKRKNLKESEFYKFLENVFLKEYGFCSKQETINLSGNLWVNLSRFYLLNGYTKDDVHFDFETDKVLVVKPRFTKKSYNLIIDDKIIKTKIDNKKDYEIFLTLCSYEWIISFVSSCDNSKFAGDFIDFVKKILIESERFFSIRNKNAVDNFNELKNEIVFIK